MAAMPTLFISHGGPNIVTDDTAPHRFLKTLAALFPEPKAIVIASAHFEAAVPTVVSDPSPGMIYDFGGFAPELYQMVYPAPGSAGIAAAAVTLLAEAGLNPTVMAHRGFDHGTWTALLLAYPQANIPVVQVAINPDRDAAHHHRIGKALEPLRHEGILLIGSGHITHNLRAVFQMMRGGGATDPALAGKVAAFIEWFKRELTSGAAETVLDWRNKAPFVAENHPTDEHLMPLFFALGAAGEGARGELLHSSTEGGVFASDFYRFQ